MKKEWVKPELVVLIKVQSNEMVLGDCKIQGAVGPIGTDSRGDPYSGYCMNVGGLGACRGHDGRGS